MSHTTRVRTTKHPPGRTIVLNVDRHGGPRPVGCRITRGLFAVGIVGALTLGTASPAFADALDAADPAPGQTTETPEQQRAREDAAETVRSTIGKAKLLLFREGPCRDHYGTSTTAYPGVDAAAVLGNLQFDGKIVNAFDTPGPEAENGPAPAEFAPNTGTITLYKDFFDTSASQVERGRVLFVPPLSTEQFQVLILLHELDHVFGKQHQNTGDDPRKLNDALAQACPNSSLPPDSPSPPGGGFAVGDGAIDGPSYTVPQYVFVDPLPRPGCAAGVPGERCD
jgi:hypothetical protein